MIPARLPLFRYEIACRSGVLVFANSPDFLATVRNAIQQRQLWRGRLPHSTLRVRLFYPNGKRVGQGDVKAALTAIRSEK